MHKHRGSEIVAGEIVAVHAQLGMIAVALRQERTRRFILPLAAPALTLLRELLGAAARGATVALRVRGSQLLELVGEERSLARAA